ncbi:hypothetical protein [Shewanella sp. Isolate11]|uniref:hypothetical protein n=1 Tax=Shewanella sp. Isolate11 TaxID=2908530 RepID=UPI001EFD956C|nr:hypothetical protein [Shewanella sp. Isolate11]MCG9695369.1 hypothetical protein [Shewanella sp. Isolate11]
MKNFIAGINNFWVGLFTGLLLPIIVIAFLLYATVHQFTDLLQESAISPIVERSELTFDKVDHLLTTLDNKVEHATAEDLQVVASLKDTHVIEELQTFASSVKQLKQAVTEADKQAIVSNVQEKLQQSLANKFPPEKAKKISQNLLSIAQILASQPHNDQQGESIPFSRALE